MKPETAAMRVRAYLDALSAGHGNLVDWAVDDTHAEHQLTVADLREMLAEVTR